MALALIAGVFPAYAADSIVFHGESSKATLHRDDTFTYTMELRSEAGDLSDLIGLSYYLRYNSDVLEVTGVEVNADELAGMGLDSMYDRTDFIHDGKVFVFSNGSQFAPAEPVAYPIQLAKVRFKVKADAEYGVYAFGSSEVSFAYITAGIVRDKAYTAELGAVTVEAVTPPTPTPSGGSGGTSSYAVTFEYRENNTLVKSERKSYARNTQLTEKDLSLPDGYELAESFSHTVTKTETVKIPIKKVGEIPTPDPQGEKPYINGYGDGTFKPDNEITRAEVMQILYNMVGNNAAASLSVLERFTDMTEPHWADTPIAWAVSNEYLGGYPDGRLAPDDFITRAELAAVLNRVAAKVKLFGEIGLAQVTLTDIDGHWAYNDIIDRKSTRLNSSH